MLLKLLRYWGVITGPSNVLLQLVNQVARNVLRKKTTRNSLSFSALIFQNCSLPGVSRSARCSVLRDMAKARKAEI